MTMRNADSTLKGHKDILSEYVTPNKHEKAHTLSRGEAPPTLRLETANQACSFPYAYVQYVRFLQGNITVRTSTAKVVIKGKNLRGLYLDIERYKTDAVTLSPHVTSDNEHPFVEAITITFDED